MTANNPKNITSCPCGTDKEYLDCCGIFINDQQTASTPEQLMRSRYTAYTQANIDYIANTMKSPAADDFDLDATKMWAQAIHWMGLDIIRTTHNATEGTVEFVARYYIDNKKYLLHEVSEFHHIDGKWYYVNGTHPSKNLTEASIEKIGRNDKCLCGSNQKYKKCCGKLA